MKAMILLHGRGATSVDIMGLSKFFGNIIYAAPQAPKRQWYPESFLAPVEKNQPFLDRSLKTVKEEIKKLDIGNKDIVIAGFSQGACLALEFAARYPGKYGGILAFSGGIITLEHKGDMKGTPVFIGCSENDPYIPKKRVEESAEIFKKLNADVKTQIYPGHTHTITEEEINTSKKMLELN